MKRKTLLSLILLPLLMLCSCQDMNMSSGQNSSENTGSVDFYATLSLLETSDKIECPTYISDSNGETYYYANSYRRFALTIESKSEKLYQGDILTFADEHTNDYFDYDGVHQLDFGYLEYSDDYDKTTYIIYLMYQGKFDINFSIDDIESNIHIDCNDSSSVWEYLQMDLSLIYPWINANNLNKNNVDKIRYERGYIGVAPGSLTDIQYSDDINDISNACNLFNAKIVRVETSINQIAGGGYSEYRYYFNDTSHKIRIVNGFVYGSESLSSKSVYRIEKLDGSTKISNPYLETHGLITYGNDNEVMVYKADGSEFKIINYLQNIEFRELYDVSIDDNMPKYYIDDLLKVNSKLDIYYPDIIKYSDVFYKITSEQNFSELFDEI